jgi:transcriptional regulator with XRE-family HTH domain
MAIEFGVRLKQLREEKNLTQTELSKRSGIHNVNLSRYERGLQQPTAEVLRKLAEALEVSIGHLMEGAPNEIPPSRLEDAELRSQLEEIERLPEMEKTVVKQFLDAFLFRHRVRNLQDARSA